MIAGGQRMRALLLEQHGLSDLVGVCYRVRCAAGGFWRAGEVL